MISIHPIRNEGLLTISDPIGFSDPGQESIDMFSPGPRGLGKGYPLEQILHCLITNSNPKSGGAILHAQLLRRSEASVFLSDNNVQKNMPESVTISPEVSG